MSRRKTQTQIRAEDLASTLNEAEIPEFNLEEDLNPNSFIVLFGRRGSGKSYLGRDIMRRFRKMPKVKVVCSSESVNHDYEKHIPGICIDDDYDPKKLETIFLDQEDELTKIDEMESQIEVLKKDIQKYNQILDSRDYHNDWRKTEKIHKHINNLITELEDLEKRLSKIDPRVLYVADDMMFHKKSILEEQQFRRLVFNGRHYKITGLYMSQYPLGVPKNMRGCIDYVFILAEDSENMRQMLYDNYAQGIFSNKYLFYKIMDNCTTDRRALVLKMTKTDNKDQVTKVATNDIERMDGKVFWYRAKDCKDFRWENPILWQIHNQLYDKDHRRRARDERREELAKQGLNLPRKKDCGVNIKLKSDGRKPEQRPSLTVSDEDAGTSNRESLMKYRNRPVRSRSRTRSRSRSPRRSQSEVHRHAGSSSNYRRDRRDTISRTTYRDRDRDNSRNKPIDYDKYKRPFDDIIDVDL